MGLLCCYEGFGSVGGKGFCGVSLALSVAVLCNNHTAQPQPTNVRPPSAFLCPPPLTLTLPTTT